MKTSLTFLKTALAVSLLASAAQAQISGLGAPVWSGDANVTRQDFYFQTPSTSPAPDVTTNPNAPVTTVVPGPFSAGHHSAPSVFDGADDNGAWELQATGNGNITSTVQVDPNFDSSLVTYTIDYYVRSVAFRGFLDMPTLTINGGSVLTPSTADVLVEDAGQGDGWYARTWEGSLTLSASNFATFRFGTVPVGGALVDTTQIYTRYAAVPVPEPGSAFLAAISFGLLLARRRRR